MRSNLGGAELAEVAVELGHFPSTVQYFNSFNFFIILITMCENLGGVELAEVAVELGLGAVGAVGVLEDGPVGQRQVLLRLREREGEGER